VNIAVCAKQVPDTAEMRIDPESNTLIREGVESILNPLDEFPLEAALKLKERCGGQVSVFTMGPPQAREVLLKAIATGADNGFLVSDKKFAGSDTWATSLILATALQKAGPFDLILCGKQAIDGDTGQVGPGIAAHLNLPEVTFVTKLELPEETSGTPEKLRVQRMLEEMTADLEVELPAVLTVLKEANEPRLPTLAGRLRAVDYQAKTITARDLELSDNQLGLQGSPTRVDSINVPKINRKQKEISGSSETVAQQLFEEITTELHDIK